MKSPLVYCRNLLGATFLKLRYGHAFSAGAVNSYHKLALEIYKPGSIELGSFGQNRGTLTLVASGGKISIGDHCFFNSNAQITAMESVTIGEYCKFGNNLVVVDHDHDFRSESMEDHYRTAPITIGDHTWVGANVVILRGTTIGAHCVIAAGSILHGDIPDHTVVVQKRTETRTTLAPAEVNE